MVPWNHGSFNKFSSNSCLSPCEHVKVYPIWLFLATCLRSKQNIQCRAFEVREASVPFLHICSQPWQLTRNRRWDSNTPNEGLIRFQSYIHVCFPFILIHNYCPNTHSMLFSHASFWEQTLDHRRLVSMHCPNTFSECWFSISCYYHGVIDLLSHWLSLLSTEMGGRRQFTCEPPPHPLRTFHKKELATL